MFILSALHFKGEEAATCKGGITYQRDCVYVYTHMNNDRLCDYWIPLPLKCSIWIVQNIMVYKDDSESTKIWQDIDFEQMNMDFDNSIEL